MHFHSPGHGFTATWLVLQYLLRFKPHLVFGGSVPLSFSEFRSCDQGRGACLNTPPISSVGLHMHADHNFTITEYHFNRFVLNCKIVLSIVHVNHTWIKR